MPALTMRGDYWYHIPMKGPRGPRMRLGKGWNAMNEESWVIAATVELLMVCGVPATAMDVEATLTRKDRPDLLVVLADTIAIYEAKAHRPTPADRRQVLRYMDAARIRWPERDVSGYLVWPATEARVLHPGGVASERVT